MKSLLIKNKTIVLLSLIILIGSILRLWQLGSVPISLNWDEVSLGYNAYSIFETGKDEFGETLPVILRSFDDYKPALYSYLIIPSYKIFGLNAFAVRLPSAVFGILTLVSVYYLIRKLFKREDLALTTTFILAISPWHIQFSRVAFESNVGLALNVFAATFFIFGLKRYWMLILSAIFAGLSIHVYQSEKVFTPLFILGLMIIYFKPFIKVPKKYIVSAFIAGVIVVLPLILYLAQDTNALLRAKGTSIFNNPTQLLERNAQRNIYNIENNNYIGAVFDNRRIVFATSILDGYMSHYYPNWLLRGDLARHHAPEMGLIYVWEFPFILIGIYALLFTKFDRRAKYFIFFWFLLAPLPASITFGVPHAVRTLNFLPTWQLFTALGLISAWGLVSSIKYQVLSIKLKHALLGLFLLFATFNFAYYLNQYFVQQNYFHAENWIYGHKQMVQEVLEREDKYSQIIISDKQPMDKSYMFYAFFMQYSPEKYQANAPSSGNFFTHQEFGKYSFRPIEWSEDTKLEDTLFVGLPQEIPASEAIFTVYYPNGEPAMRMAER